MLYTVLLPYGTGHGWDRARLRLTRIPFKPYLGPVISNATQTMAGHGADRLGSESSDRTTPHAKRMQRHTLLACTQDYAQL